ncbi:hypothetical protein HELRODRAFT_78406 [Helobdella robusta]|uniref:MIP18 family-like domain-containing protein n=1 Tax=Helobdella robusta TaxID=6412 RepID=T1G3B5_HELRO|nr:hypothetical protein HELRODRAFT_78406 [Helobdella robusta]ESO04879.1 hypothetical protein HELRODRAFT_78406 [Helobdella robusta]
MQPQDLCKGIRDPEKPATLEELNIIQEENIHLIPISNTTCIIIEVFFVPTVPHCHLATVIGLCLTVKLQECLPKKYKIRVKIKEGSHDSELEINKQLNDKERVSAAMENPSLSELVNTCIHDT